MDVEESIRGNPIDGVVLLCGCDKTTPSLLMGAASCDLPALVVSGGPMLNGKHRGQNIGSGTSVWEFSEQVRAGKMSLPAFMEAEAGMSRSWGHCMTMGTASTMASIVEALGLSLPHNAALPGADSRRLALAHLSGQRIVEMVNEDLVMSRVLTRQAFENAIMVGAAIGGSTNAVVHLLALAGRIGVPLELDDWNRVGQDIPCLANLMPSGKFLMEDFCYAGGLPGLIRRLEAVIHQDALTVNGHTLWDNCKRAEVFDDDVIRPWNNPVAPNGGVKVLRGSLAPSGAVIKPSAATPSLLKHRGRALVFEDIDDFKARIDSPDLDVLPEDILVLKNCGPKGYPGFPEVGNMPLPKKLLEQGITDMVRISDARMSGTAYGTVVLHTAPEAAIGGPLALVQSGDFIELDVARGSLDLIVPEEELEARRATFSPPPTRSDRGYAQLYHDRVLGADRGVDFDFLVGKSGAAVPRDSH
jgi:dihydroxy-acid dehydratase